MEWGRWIHALQARWRAIVQSRRADEDLRSELSFHVAMQTHANLQRGMSGPDAEREARLAIGGVEQAEERSRDARPLRWAHAFVLECGTHCDRCDGRLLHNRRPSHTRVGDRGEHRDVQPRLRRAAATAPLRRRRQVGPRLPGESQARPSTEPHLSSRFRGLARDALVHRDGCVRSHPSEPHRARRSGRAPSRVCHRRILRGTRLASSQWAPAGRERSPAGQPQRGHQRSAVADTFRRRHRRAETRYISSDYTRAMGIPLRRGTLLPDRLATGAPLPILISETAARRFWPDEESIGRMLRASWGASLVVTGVVADVRQLGLAEEPAPAFYLPQTIAPRLLATLAVRVAGDPLTLVGPIRQAIRELDPNQPIRSIATLRGVMSESIARDRFFTLLFGVFGGLALVLSAVGVYGVIAYSVGQHTQEIGVRMALGARAADILQMVVREGMFPVFAGITLGGLSSLLLTRVLQSQLYGVSAKDPVAFVIAPAILAGVALLACYVPARRATRIDPMTALRNE
jgi:hypothetical protein